MTTQNSIEENKRIVRAFIETAFNQHQADRAADYLTPDMKWHGGTLGTVDPSAACQKRSCAADATPNRQQQSPRNFGLFVVLDNRLLQWSDKFDMKYVTGAERTVRQILEQIIFAKQLAIKNALVWEINYARTRARLSVRADCFRRCH